VPWRGAAGAGRAGVDDDALDVLHRRPSADAVMEPDPGMREPLAERFERYRALCEDVRDRGSRTLASERRGTAATGR